jgi:hypothetical protein
VTLHPPVLAWVQSTWQQDLQPGFSSAGSPSVCFAGLRGKTHSNLSVRKLLNMSIMSQWFVRCSDNKPHTINPTSCHISVRSSARWHCVTGWECLTFWRTALPSSSASRTSGGKKCALQRNSWYRAVSLGPKRGAVKMLYNEGYDQHLVTTRKVRGSEMQLRQSCTFYMHGCSSWR